IGDPDEERIGMGADRVAPAEVRLRADHPGTRLIIAAALDHADERICVMAAEICADSRKSNVVESQSGPGRVLLARPYAACGGAKIAAGPVVDRKRGRRKSSAAIQRRRDRYVSSDCRAGDEHRRRHAKQQLSHFTYSPASRRQNPATPTAFLARGRGESVAQPPHTPTFACADLP